MGAPTLVIIQNLRVDNHKDFFMHFPSMSRNGQVATEGYNGQAFF